MNINKTPCHKCGMKMVEVEDGYKEEYCCGGGFYDQCGCGGFPMNPVFCDDCESKLFDKDLNNKVESE